MFLTSTPEQFGQQNSVETKQERVGTDVFVPFRYFSHFSQCCLEHFLTVSSVNNTM